MLMNTVGSDHKVAVKVYAKEKENEGDKRHFQ